MSILIGFVCLLLSGFLFALPSPRKQPNLFLAGFLALTAIELTVWLWGASDYIWTWQSTIWLALGKLQMPVFFFFFVASCYSDFRLRMIDLVHGIPFALTLLVNWPGLGSFGFLGDLLAPGGRVSWITSQLIYFGYLTAILLLLWRFRRRFQQQHSGARSEVLLWLTQLAAASLFARLVILSRDLLADTVAGWAVPSLQIFGALLALGITSWIALKSLLQPHLFRDVDRRLLRLPIAGQPVGSFQLESLRVRVESEQVYLDPDLNLERLAFLVAMTPREVSELLNQSAGMHFFDFINGYRVRHAQDLLERYPQHTILQILTDSGFNSKSSFNTAFKKQTGMTPSAYRSKLTSR
ncbi:helix-turn-helix domain-containing protein [Maricaulis sp. MIT060901]|uniref:helix-turn-helix domain-containing protein n=1 Tax=Maricaulis sp. MIT060901 TaxID=3096993 RepID=UPI00399A01E6